MELASVISLMVYWRSPEDAVQVAGMVIDVELVDADGAWGEAREGHRDTFDPARSAVADKRFEEVVGRRGEGWPLGMGDLRVRGCGQRRGWFRLGARDRRR